jgi:hypothetical protein
MSVVKVAMAEVKVAMVDRADMEALTTPDLLLQRPP